MFEFLTANWLWIVLIVGFLVLHRSGMGCGMGHGGHGGHTSERSQTDGRQSSHGGCGMGHSTSRDDRQEERAPEDDARGVR